MTRKSKVALAVIVLAGMVGVVGWYALQPKYRFATRAEVEALIDPSLKVPLPRDSDAEARYGRYVKLIAQKPSGVSQDPLRSQIERLVREGPISAPPAKLYDSVDSFPRMAQAKELIKYYSAEANNQASSDSERSVNALINGYRYERWLRGSLRSVIGFLVDVAVRAILDAAAANVARAGVYSPVQLQRLLSEMDNGDMDKEVLRRCFLGEMQDQTIPMIPHLGLDQQSVKDLARRFGTPEQRYDGIPPGTYDAIEQAKTTDVVGLAFLRSLDRPFNKIDLSGDDLVARLQEGLPEEPDNKTNDVKAKLEDFWYEVRLNNFPNSFGRQILFSFTKPLLQALAKIRTSAAATRSVVAMMIYRGEHGRLPATLDAVKQFGVQPTDYFTGQELHYDSARKLLWSVGVNAKDDGGAIGSNFGRGLDAGYSLGSMKLVTVALPGPLKGSGGPLGSER